LDNEMECTYPACTSGCESTGGNHTKVGNNSIPRYEAGQTRAGARKQQLIPPLQVKSVRKKPAVSEGDPPPDLARTSLSDPPVTIAVPALGRAREAFYWNMAIAQVAILLFLSSTKGLCVGGLAREAGSGGPS